MSHDAPPDQFITAWHRLRSHLGTVRHNQPEQHHHWASCSLRLRAPLPVVLWSGIIGEQLEPGCTLCSTPSQAYQCHLLPTRYIPPFQKQRALPPTGSWRKKGEAFWCNSTFAVSVRLCQGHLMRTTAWSNFLKKKEQTE